LFLTVLAVVALVVGSVPRTYAQIPAIPEPPIILYGTVTDESTSQAVAITTVAWQVTDGTTTRGYSPVGLPTTRVVDQNRASFYLLEIHQETRVLQSTGGPLSLQAGANGFDVKTRAPTYTLTAIINGSPATIRAVDGANTTPGTTSATINDCTPATQGRMMRVDLWIHEQTDPYLILRRRLFRRRQQPPSRPHRRPGR
jgi:hypothetical protein